MDGTPEAKGKGLARVGGHGVKLRGACQGCCTCSRRRRRQVLPLQRPPTWQEQSRGTKAHAWHLKGSSLGQEGPGQSYGAQLHGTCQSLPWREACCGVPGKWCWAGITQGPADPGAEGY